MENVPSSTIIMFVSIIIAMSVVVLLAAAYNGQNDAAVSQQSKFTSQTNTVLTDRIARYDGESFDGTEVLSLIKYYKDDKLSLMTQNKNQTSPSFYTYRLQQNGTDKNYILGAQVDFNAALLNATDRKSAAYINPETEYRCAMVYSPAGEIIGMTFTQGNVAESYPVVEIVKSEAHQTYYVTFDAGIQLPQGLIDSLSSRGWVNSHGNVFTYAYTDGSVTLPDIQAVEGPYTFRGWKEVAADGTGSDVSNTTVRYVDGVAQRNFRANWEKVSTEIGYTVKYFFEQGGAYPDNDDDADMTLTGTIKTGETISVDTSLRNLGDYIQNFSPRLVSIWNDPQYRDMTTTDVNGEMPLMAAHYDFDEDKSSPATQIAETDGTVIRLYYKEMHTIELDTGDGLGHQTMSRRYHYGTPYSEIVRDFAGLEYSGAGSAGGQDEADLPENIWVPERDANGNPVWDMYVVQASEGKPTWIATAGSWYDKVLNNDEVKTDAKFELKWAAQNYAIILDAGRGTINTANTPFTSYPGGKASTSDPNNYYRCLYHEGDFGGTVTLPTPTPASGSGVFIGWVGSTIPEDGKTVSTKRPEGLDIYNGNMRFTATYGSETTVAVSFSANGGTITSFTAGDGHTSTGTSVQAVLQGKAGMTLNRPYVITNNVKISRRGYSLVGWYDQNGNKVTELSKLPTASATYTARWTPVKYPITYNLNSGTVNGSSINHKQNAAYPASYSIEDEISLNAPTRDAFMFKEWLVTYKNDSGKTQTTQLIEFNKMPGTMYGTGPITVTATFEQATHNYYTVRFIPTSGGTPETKSVKKGDIIGTMPTPSRDYYDMSGWYRSLDMNGKGVGDRVFPSTVVNGDITLYAEWTPLEYRITYDTGLHVEKGSGKKDGMPSGTKYTYTVDDPDYTPPAPAAQKQGDNNITYVFGGWNVMNSDGIISENTDGTIKSHTHGDIKLSAVWRGINVPTGGYNEAFENVIPALINQERKKAGLPALTFTTEIHGYARVRASEQVILYGHTRPDGTAWNTVNSNVLNGECVARYYNTPEEVVAGWMNSDVHRILILSKTFKSAGIGVYDDTHTYQSGGVSTTSHEYYFALEFSDQ